MLNHSCCGAIRPGKFCSECGSPIRAAAKHERPVVPEGTPKIRAYIRASTTKQEMSPAVQKSRAAGFVEWTITDRQTSGRPVPKFGGFYEDFAVSASRPFCMRPAAMVLKAACRPGDIVVFAKLDRGFRDTIDLLSTVDQFKKMGVTCCFLDIQLDTGTDIGRLVLTIVGAVAEFERSRIAARTRDAYLERVKSGKFSGNFTPYCTRRVFTGEYKVTPRGKRVKVFKLEPDPAQRALGRLVTKLRDVDNLSFNKIAKFLNDTGHYRTWSKEPLWDRHCAKNIYYTERRQAYREGRNVRDGIDFRPLGEDAPEQFRAPRPENG